MPESHVYAILDIEDRAFSNCVGITKIELPPKLEKIGSYAFMGCTGLTEMTIPATVKSIGDLAFWNRENLKTVNVSRGVQIHERAFNGAPVEIKYID